MTSPAGRARRAHSGIELVSNAAGVGSIGGSVVRAASQARAGVAGRMSTGMGASHSRAASVDGRVELIGDVAGVRSIGSSVV